MTKPSVTDVLLRKKRNLKNGYYSMTFGPFPKASQCKPGQFLHLQLPSTDILFRRAFSIADVRPQEGEVEIIFKILGRGTTLLSKLRTGDQVNLLGPLGTTFKLPRKKQTVVMVAGGVGFPPLLYLAKTMIERGVDPGRIEFFYGGASSADIIERARLKKLEIKFHPVTIDGSFGDKGLVTQPVEALLDLRKGSDIQLYACGPEGMLKATDELAMKYGVEGQLSLEAPMPCGVGICLGCVVELRAGGHARVCREGPVFEVGEVIL